MSEFSGDRRASTASSSFATRPEDLERARGEEVEQLEVGLLRGLARAGVRVVGAEREDTDPSSIEFFDVAGARRPSTTSTSSRARSPLVLALDGADGNFGVKETADSCCPT